MSDSQTITSFDELIERAAKLRDESVRTVLGLAGPPGAGKTTVAQALVERLNSMPGNSDTTALLPLDGYHLPNAVLDQIGLRDRKGSPDTFDVDAYAELLTNVGSSPDKKWFAPGFSRITDEPVPDEHCISPQARLVVTEGNYLLLGGKWSQIRPACKEIWFVDVDHDVERNRLIQRWLDHGRTEEAAIDWVDRSDLANAQIIRDQSTAPDFYVRLPEGAL